MYRASPPALRARAHPLRISGAARQVFDEQADSARALAYRAYLADMARPYGVSVHRDTLGEGFGQSYGDMADALLSQVVPADQPVDLLVMAFAVPDVMPWRCTASHLSYRCPGNPMAFAVCDCGTTAAFTGLRLIRAHAVGTNSPRALLMVLEQAAIHHELPVPAATPARHAAVALRCDPAGSHLVDSVRLRTGVGRSEAGSVLAAGLAELAAGHEDVTVVAGAGLAQEQSSPGGATPRTPRGMSDGEAMISDMLAAALPVAAEVVLAPAGQPCTGVWWEVAGRLSEWAVAGRRVLVADYDPLPGSLCLAAIDVEGPFPR